MMGDQVRWQGAGRWLSFAVAALLVILAVPSLETDDAAVGWNVFLGLLLFGAVASGYRRAPLVLLVLFCLMLLRLVVAMAIEQNIIASATDGVLLIPLFFAWQDLKRQSALLNQQAPEQAS